MPRSSSTAGNRELTERSTAEGVYPSLVLTVCAPLEPMEAALKALAWLLAVTSSAIWLASGLLCRRLSHSALAPLRRMVESARGLDATDAGWRLDEPRTGDELDTLGQAFNDLLARLHGAFQSQSQFSSDASHQLRTPLAVMIGQMQVAIRQERSTTEYRRALESSLARAIQLAEIVESLLSLARGDAQGSVPAGETLELRTWVARFLEGREAIWSEMVDNRVAGRQDLWIHAHSGLLDQLLENLLDNAVKHGDPDGPIVVETAQVGSHAILAVEDRGPGIHEDDRERVFQPFYRSESTRRRRVPGVGLGLAVVERIAKSLAGSISVSRSASGRGSRFEVQFPLVETRANPTSAPAALLPAADSPSSCTLL
jgi:signal transduction histidine kinase